MGVAAGNIQYSRERTAPVIWTLRFNRAAVRAVFHAYPVEHYCTVLGKNQGLTAAGDVCHSVASSHRLRNTSLVRIKELNALHQSQLSKFCMVMTGFSRLTGVGFKAEPRYLRVQSAKSQLPVVAKRDGAIQLKTMPVQHKQDGIIFIRVIL